MTTNNPISDAALAELDRLGVSASRGGLASLVDQETYRSELARTYPALRQRLLDVESRLAEVERERDAAEALVAGLRGALETLNHAAKVAISTEYGGCFDEETPLVIRLLDGTCDETDAALALTPASAGNWTDEETEAANGR